MSDPAVPSDGRELAPAGEGFLQATRDAYDAMLQGYLDLVEGRLERRPLARAALSAFAELVRTGGRGPAADIGCGPGHVTDFLAGLGLDVFGVDLSPAMVEHARCSYPGLRFELGSMLDPDLADGALGGILAWYSIIHVPWRLRAEVFAQFHRVLAPGGHLLLGFQIGSDVMHRDEAFGRPVNCDWYRQQPDDVTDLLRDAGFRIWSTTVVEGDELELLPQGYILAAKPDRADPTPG